MNLVGGSDHQNKKIEEMIIVVKGEIPALSKDQIEEIFRISIVEELEKIRCKDWNNLMFYPASIRNDFFHFVLKKVEKCLVALDLKKDKVELLMKELTVTNQRYYEVK